MESDSESHSESVSGHNSEESDDDEEGAQPGATPRCDVSSVNILPSGSRRMRVTPTRFVDQLYQDPEVRRLLLEDIPPEEMQAALVDSDYSSSEGSGSESGSDDSFVD